MKRETPGKYTSEPTHLSSVTPKQPGIETQRQNQMKRTGPSTNLRQESMIREKTTELSKSKLKNQTKNQQRNQYEKNLPYYRNFMEKYNEPSQNTEKSRQNFIMKVEQNPNYSRQNRSPSFSQMNEYWGIGLTKQILSHLEECPIFITGTQRNSSKSKLIFPQVLMKTKCDCTTSTQKIKRALKQKEKRRQILKSKIQDYNKPRQIQCGSQTPSKSLKNPQKDKTASQNEKSNRIPSSPLNKKAQMSDEVLISPRKLLLQSFSEAENNDSVFKHKPQCQYEKLLLDESTPKHKIKCSCLLGDDEAKDEEQTKSKNEQFLRNIFGGSRILISEEEQPSTEEIKPFENEILQSPMRQKLTQKEFGSSESAKHKNFMQKLLPSWFSPKQQNTQTQRVLSNSRKSNASPRVNDRDSNKLEAKVIERMQQSDRKGSQSKKKQGNVQFFSQSRYSQAKQSRNSPNKYLRGQMSSPIIAQVSRQKTRTQISQSLVKQYQFFQNQDFIFASQLQSLSTSSHLYDVWIQSRMIELGVNESIIGRNQQQLEKFKLMLDDSTANYELNISEQEFIEAMRRKIRDTERREPQEIQLRMYWPLRRNLNSQILERISSLCTIINDYENANEQYSQNQDQIFNHLAESDTYNTTPKGPTPTAQPSIPTPGPQNKPKTQPKKPTTTQKNQQTPQSSKKSRINQIQSKDDFQYYDDSQIYGEKKVQQPPDHWKDSPKRPFNKNQTNINSNQIHTEGSNSNAYQKQSSPKAFKKRSQRVRYHQESEKKKRKERLLEKHENISEDIDLQTALAESYSLAMSVQPTDDVDFGLINKANEYILYGLEESKKMKAQKQQGFKLLKKAKDIINQASQSQKKRQRYFMQQRQHTSKEKRQILKENQERERLNQQIENFLNSSYLSVPQQEYPLISGSPPQKIQERQSYKQQKSPSRSFRQRQYYFPKSPNSRNQTVINSPKEHNNSKSPKIKKENLGFQAQIKVLDLIKDNQEKEQLEKNLVLNSLRNTDIKFERSIQKKQKQQQKHQINHKNQPQINQIPEVIRPQQIPLGVFQQIDEDPLNNQPRQRYENDPQRVDLPQIPPLRQIPNAHNRPNNQIRIPRRQIGAGGGDGGGGDSGDDADRDRDRENRDRNRNNRNPSNPWNRNRHNLDPNPDYAKMLLDQVPHYHDLLNIFMSNMSGLDPVAEFNTRFFEFRLNMFANYIIICCKYYPTQMKQRIKDIWRKDQEMLTYFKGKGLQIPKSCQQFIGFLSIGIIEFARLFFKLQPLRRQLPMQQQDYRDLQDGLNYANYTDQKRMNVLIQYGMKLERQNIMRQQNYRNRLSE